MGLPVAEGQRGCAGATSGSRVAHAQAARLSSNRGIHRAMKFITSRGSMVWLSCGEVRGHVADKEPARRD
jgi:hypothetical protein